MSVLEGINWAIVGQVIAGLVAVYLAIKKGKTSRALKAAVGLLQTVYSAVEENGEASGVKAVKREVAKSVEAMGEKIPLLGEVEAAVMSTVDPKPDKDVPAIKRFWRRFLKGENLAGVAARVVLSKAT